MTKLPLTDTEKRLLRNFETALRKADVILDAAYEPLDRTLEEASDEWDGEPEDREMLGVFHSEAQERLGYYSDRLQELDIEIETLRRRWDIDKLLPEQPRFIASGAVRQLFELSKHVLEPELIENGYGGEYVLRFLVPPDSDLESLRRFSRLQFCSVRPSEEPAA